MTRIVPSLWSSRLRSCCNGSDAKSAPSARSRRGPTPRAVQPCCRRRLRCAGSGCRRCSNRSKNERSVELAGIAELDFDRERRITPGCAVRMAVIDVVHGRTGCRRRTPRAPADGSQVVIAGGTPEEDRGRADPGTTRRLHIARWCGRQGGRRNRRRGGCRGGRRRRNGRSGRLCRWCRGRPSRGMGRDVRRRGTPGEHSRDHKSRHCRPLLAHDAGYPSPCQTSPG